MLMNYSDLGDDELIESAIRGSDEAFTEFCVRSLPALLEIMRSQCRRFGVPPDLARDCVQEALLRMVEQRKGNPRTVSTGWLVTVAKNFMFDWMRKERRKKALDEEQFANVPEVERGGDDVSAVFEGFKRLSQRDQEILGLILLEGCSPPEAAARLDIQAWSAYKRYERALTRLRDAISGLD
jgi:RNA polymerase sigma factor (sigma-70 family)